MSVNTSRPAACAIIPATSSGFGPTRVTARDANVEPAMMQSVIGRKARPALIGEYPSTCWRYSDRKNHIPNTAAPTSNTTTFAALSVRDE